MDLLREAAQALHDEGAAITPDSLAARTGVPASQIHRAWRGLREALPEGLMPARASAPTSTSQRTPVADRIRLDIARGVYHPGEQLFVRDLRATYGVQPDAIYRALHKLVREGFVTRDDHAWRVAADPPGAGPPRD
jgi:DNA-binding IclR family transcriptional regulator